MSRRRALSDVSRHAAARLDFAAIVDLVDRAEPPAPGADLKPVVNRRFSQNVNGGDCHRASGSSLEWPVSSSSASSSSSALSALTHPLAI